MQKCPKEMAPHIGILTTICLNLLAYDPNYNYEVIFLIIILFYFTYLFLIRFFRRKTMTTKTVTWKPRKKTKIMKKSTPMMTICPGRL